MWGLNLDDLMGFRAIFSVSLLLCCVRYSVKTCRTSATGQQGGGKALPPQAYPQHRRDFVFRVIF